MELNLGLALLAGLVSFLSPCVLPLVPAYIGYMSGRATHSVAMQTTSGSLIRPSVVSRFDMLLHGIAFVAGFTFVFVTFGLLTTAFIQQIGGQNIALVREIIGRSGGLLIIVFGLHFMGAIGAASRWLLGRPRLLASPLSSITFAIVCSAILAWALVDWLLGLVAVALLLLALFLGGAFTQPSQFWNNLLMRLISSLYADTRRKIPLRDGQSYPSSALMGVIFAAGWTPCIGPIYGSILTLAATGSEISQAGALLVAYSLGLGIPFMLAALLFDGAQTALKRVGRHLRRIEVFAGIVLVVVGVTVASGRLQLLSQNFAVQFADFSYRLEECVTDIASGERALGDIFSCMNADDSTTA